MIIAERVRQLLGVDEAYLKDDEVLLPEFLPSAKRTVYSSLPKLKDADLSDEISDMVETAIVYRTAILFTPSLPYRFPKKQKGEHAEFEVEVKNIKDDLEEQYYGILNEIDKALNEDDDDGNFLSLFKIGGARKKSNCCRRCRW